MLQLTKLEGELTASILQKRLQGQANVSDEFRDQLLELLSSVEWVEVSYELDSPMSLPRTRGGCSQEVRLTLRGFK